VLNDAADNSVELQNRLALAVKTCCQLKLFWDKANTGAHWKLRVFNAIVRSKLMYGLENLQLTHAEMNKLDAFQMKSLRRILNIPPTFIDRTQTNQVVREQVNNMVLMRQIFLGCGKTRSSNYLDIFFVQTTKTHFGKCSSHTTVSHQEISHSKEEVGQN
jgi:hypothetical protein